MIALALRKRFAQMNQVHDSPERDRRDSERDQEREDSFSESAEPHYFGNNNTPKHGAAPAVGPKPNIGQRGPPSPRKLFVYTRPAAVGTSVDNKEEGSPVIPV